MRKLLTVALLLAGGAFAQTATQSIAQVVQTDPNFSTLLAALQAADLVTTLDDASQQFTVFAPTNDAFAKVPKDALDALLADKEGLKNVLLYHVVSGSTMASSLNDGAELTTVQGAPLKVSISSGTVMINDATVTQADVAASNGVIHVIDTVLMPPAP